MIETPSLLPVPVTPAPHNNNRPGFIATFKRNPFMAMFIVLIIISALIVLGLITTSLLTENHQSPQSDIASSSQVVIPEIFKEFNLISLEAQSALVMDTVTGTKLYWKNENTQLPLASITKLMTAATAADYLSEDTIITLSQKDLDTEGESDLVAGENYSFDNAVRLMMQISSNDMAEALSRTVEEKDPSSKSFEELMNEKALQIEMKSSKFNNPTGLDTDEVKGIAGPVSTASDIEKLFSYVLDNELWIVESTGSPTATITTKDGRRSVVQNTNILSSDLPGLIGSKTGYTLLAGGNLVVAFDAGIAHPVIIVVLGSSKEGRFKDMKTLYNASMSAFKNSIPTTI